MASSRLRSGRVLAASLALACAAVATNASATSLGIDFDPSAAEDFGPNVWNLGWSFTVNSEATVYALGNWAGGTPFPQDQQVGLWDSSGNLLASVFVSNSSTSVGQWKFSGITPVSLTVGATYVVGGQGDADYTGEVASVTVDPSISYVTDLYTYNGGANSPLVEPVLTESAPYSWFGGNVLLSAIAAPEPATWAMMLIGFGLVGGTVRRGSRKVRVAFA